MATAKKGLGRGLSALIPDGDMEFLSRVARGDDSLPAMRVQEAQSIQDPEHKGQVTEGQVTEGQVTGSRVTGSRVTEGQSQKASNFSRQSAPGVTTSSVPLTSENMTPSALQQPPEHLDNVPLWVGLQTIQPNPYQPRRVFAEEEMQDLITSVREHGIIQPILLRPIINSQATDSPFQYQLIAGERRWRAAQEAGLTKVPAVVRRVSDQQALELALIENVQRYDISAMDAAKAYRRLADEFSLSQEDIARRVGKSRPAIANTMRLLDLPEEAQKAIEDGIISEGHGRAILLAPGVGARKAVLRRVLRDKVTVRETEELSRRSTLASIDSRTSSKSSDKETRLTGVEIRALRATEEELSKLLGTKVRVRPRAKGGQLSIEYFSTEDLDQLLGRLRGSGN